MYVCPSNRLELVVERHVVMLLCAVGFLIMITVKGRTSDTDRNENSPTMYLNLIWMQFDVCVCLLTHTEELMSFVTVG